jgi:hypothetical protein
MDETKPLMGAFASPLSTVVERVQNPALGATLVCACSAGYQAEVGEPLPFHLAFLVLPMVLHEKTLTEIQSTYSSSGLAKFAFKFRGHEDELLSIHDRMLILRGLTLDSVSMALASKLLSLNYETACLAPLRVRGRPTQGTEVERMLDAATKLGKWFARLPLQQIASMLRVEF